MKKISPQQRWNRKHRDILRKSEHKYYRKNRKRVIAHNNAYKHNLELKHKKEKIV